MEGGGGWEVNGPGWMTDHRVSIYELFVYDFRENLLKMYVAPGNCNVLPFFCLCKICTNTQPEPFRCQAGGVKEKIEKGRACPKTK